MKCDKYTPETSDPVPFNLIFLYYLFIYLLIVFLHLKTSTLLKLSAIHKQEYTTVFSEVPPEYCKIYFKNAKMPTIGKQLNKILCCQLRQLVYICM